MASKSCKTCLELSQSCHRLMRLEREGRGRVSVRLAFRLTFRANGRPHTKFRSIWPSGEVDITRQCLDRPNIGSAVDNCYKRANKASVNLDSEVLWNGGYSSCSA